MWVFISSEVMLFVGIVAVALVMRLSGLEQGWPSSFSMHVDIFTGILNTVVLVLSGVTAWAIFNAAREDRPLSAKLWLVATLLLGMTFLGIKGTEYWNKYRLGLIALPGEVQIYDEVDVTYVSAVGKRIRQEIAALESQRDEQAAANQPLADEDNERLELLNSLKEYMFEATTKVAGRTESPKHANLLMRLMARQIFPSPETERNLVEVVEPEMQILSARLLTSTERLFLVNRRLEIVRRQILSLEQEIDQLQLLGTDAPELEAKTSWVEVKKQQMVGLDEEKNELETRIEPITGRLRHLEANSEEEGINERHGLAVTSGNAKRSFVDEHLPVVNRRSCVASGWGLAGLPVVAAEKTGSASCPGTLCDLYVLAIRRRCLDLHFLVYLFLIRVSNVGQKNPNRIVGTGADFRGDLRLAERVRSNH